MLYVQNMIKTWERKFNPMRLQKDPCGTWETGMQYKGVKFVFKKYTVSIQWGAMNYCDNRAYAGDNILKKTENAEIGVWLTPNGDWLKLGDCDDVLGYQTIDEIEVLLQKYCD